LLCTHSTANEPRFLGPYEIVSIVGAEAGMGEVYRGRDPQLNRAVVLDVARKPTRFVESSECVARTSELDAGMLRHGMTAIDTRPRS
jgi:hypothetical protein